MSARGVRAWLAVALCHLPIAASAQQTAVSHEALLPPSAPAFALLGIEPSAVQRPETPKAVTATLLSLFGDVGKDFQAANAPRSKLLSSIGINVGFGPKPLVQVGPQ